jgi:hypothetical protein
LIVVFVASRIRIRQQPATSPGVQHLDHSILAGAPVHHGRWHQWEGTWYRRAEAVTCDRFHRHRRGCLPLIFGTVVFVLLLLLILSSLCLLLLLLLLFELVYVRSKQQRELFETETVILRRQRRSTTMVIGRRQGGEERLRTYCWVELSSKPPVLFVVESQPFGTGDSLSSSNRRHVFLSQLLVFFFSRNNEKRDLFLRRELVNHPFQTWTNLRMLIQINE